MWRRTYSYGSFPFFCEHQENFSSCFCYTLLQERNPHPFSGLLTDISKNTTRGAANKRRDTCPRSPAGPGGPSGSCRQPRSPTLSAVLGAGFSFPLAINIALIFAATAAAASSAPDGAAELSEPAAAGPPSPPPGKGRPGSGAVPGRRKAGAGPGWSHLLRRLQNGEPSVPAGRGLPGAPAAEPPRLAAAAPKPRPAGRPPRAPPRRPQPHPPAAPASRCPAPPADMAPARLHRLRASRSVISGLPASPRGPFRPLPWQQR